MPALSVAELYGQLEVPPNLQRHMLRAAAVARLILDAWRGPALDQTRVIRVLLVHDLGNIVKADYDALPEMLEEELPRVEHWRAVQARQRARYGLDAAAATRAMAAEAGLDDDEQALLAAMDFWRTREAAEGENFEVMLAAYADHRVAPFGVVSQRERFAEARARYADAPGAPMATAKAQAMIAAAYRIEDRLFAHCTIAPNTIDDRAVAPVIASLREQSFRRRG